LAVDETHYSWKFLNGLDLEVKREHKTLYILDFKKIRVIEGMVELPVGNHLKVVFEGFHDFRSFQLGFIFQSVYFHVSHGLGQSPTVLCIF
jgi:hypothetical protein